MKHFPIPAEVVGEVRGDGVVVDQSRRKVADSPPFDTDDAVPQPSYQREVYEYYGCTVPPGPYPGGARYASPRGTARAVPRDRRECSGRTQRIVRLENGRSK